MNIKLDRLYEQEFSREKLNIIMIFCMIISFFYGRAFIFEVQNPFILALCAAVATVGFNITLVAAVSILGLLSLGIKTIVLRHMVAIFLFIALSHIWAGKNKMIINIALASFSSFLTGFIYIYAKDYLTYDLIMITSEAVLVGVLGYIFYIIINYLKNYNDKKMLGITKKRISEVKDDFHENKMQEYAVKKLMDTSKIFSDISISAKDIDNYEVVLKDSDIDTIIEDSMDELCINCQNYNVCWKNNMQETYESIFAMIKDLENNRNINSILCFKMPHLKIKLEEKYKTIKLSIANAERLKRNKYGMCNQLEEISNVIKKLANNLEKDITFDINFEKRLREKMLIEGIQFKNIWVRIIDGIYEMEIVLEHNNEAMEKKITNIMNSMDKKKFYISDKKVIIDKNLFSITLSQATEFNVSLGISQCAKEGNQSSGDSYSSCELKDGKYMILLSDGMGSGEKAAKQSKITIELLEKLLIADFDKYSAIRSLNELLLLSAKDDNYATLDILVIDKHNAQSQLLKLGSASSYIKKGSEVKRIDSEALPIGIVEPIDITSNSFELMDADMIIMITDGISDYKMAKDVNWIEQLIKQHDTGNPQLLADSIMREAMSLSKGMIVDDMSVVVTKIGKN